MHLPGSHRFLLATALAVLVFAALTPALAQTGSGLDPSLVVGPPEGRPLSGEELFQLTEKVAGDMRCPVCQGLSVADSQTATAVAMKAEIRQMLEAGYSPRQVLDYFEESYGEFIRLAPKAEGFNLFVWIAPVAALLIGMALVIQQMRKKKPVAVEAGAETVVDDELHVARTKYYAVSTIRLLELLREAGFENAQRIDGRFFQPVLIAR